MNNNIKELKQDRLAQLDLVNISVTDELCCADLNIQLHSMSWLAKKLKALGYAICDQYARGNLVTVYFR